MDDKEKKKISMYYRIFNIMTLLCLIYLWYKKSKYLYTFVMGLVILNLIIYYYILGNKKDKSEIRKLYTWIGLFSLSIISHKMFGFPSRPILMLGGSILMLYASIINLEISFNDFPK